MRGKRLSGARGADCFSWARASSGGSNVVNALMPAARKSCRRDNGAAKGVIEVSLREGQVVIIAGLQQVWKE
jgi:hypothetical protein